MEVPINYLAVVAAGVAAMTVGFLWYGPLFGKKWLALSGMTQTNVEAAEASSMTKSYLLTFAGSLIMSYVLAHSLVFASAYLQTTGISAGLMAGFWSWLGFVAPVTLGNVLWERKPWGLWVFNNGHYLVALLVMGLILAVWQ